MCPHNLESQLYPGLYQQNCGHWGEGGDSAPLLCTGETSPGVLHPEVESSLEKRGRCRPVGAHPEEGHKNDPRDETPLLPRQAERAGADQPGEEKALERLDSGFLVSKGGL